MFGIFEKVIIVGIVKWLEEIYFLGDFVFLYINKKLEFLKIIQQVWDEVYWFVIMFY